MNFDTSTPRRPVHHHLQGAQGSTDPHRRSEALLAQRLGESHGDSV